MVVGCHASTRNTHALDPQIRRLLKVPLCVTRLGSSCIISAKYVGVNNHCGNKKPLINLTRKSKTIVPRMAL
jgi:hypothetical protein